MRLGSLVDSMARCEARAFSSERGVSVAQERTRLNEPLKAKARRRVVFGLREAAKALRTKKAGRARYPITAPLRSHTGPAPRTNARILIMGAQRLNYNPIGRWRVLRRALSPRAARRRPRRCW